jgi:SOS-response transcriptional repressor LexA
MMDVGAEIKRRRKALGWTGVKLATLAGISSQHLSRIENGRSYYTRETLMKICGALGISVDALYAAGSNSNVEPAEIGYRKVPVLDYVQAGRWMSVDGRPKDEDIQETILTDLEHPPSTFALRLRGDSMAPMFQEGDIVVVAPTVATQPGDYVVATDENGEATFKQYRVAGRNERGQEVFELHPLNPIYAVMRSDRQPLAIVGTMIEHRRYRKR